LGYNLEFAVDGGSVPDPDNTEPAEGGPSSAEVKSEEPLPASGRFATPIFVGLVAGGILLTAFAVAVLRKGDRSLLPHLSGAAPVPSLGKGEEGAPSITSPLGTVPHGPLTLRWIKVPGIEDYEAYIYDNRFQVVWRSGKVEADLVDVPERILKQIRQGPTYFWRVVGYHGNGIEESSPTVQFVIAP
jgi:hypothetical protein